MFDQASEKPKVFILENRGVCMVKLKAYSSRSWKKVAFSQKHTCSLGQVQITALILAKVLTKLISQTQTANLQNHFFKKLLLTT